MNQYQRINKKKYLGRANDYEIKLPILKQLTFKRSYQKVQFRNNKKVYELKTQTVQSNLILNCIQKSQQIRIRTQGQQIILSFFSKQYFQNGSYVASTSNKNTDISINEFEQLVCQVLSLQNCESKLLSVENFSKRQVFKSLLKKQQNKIGTSLLNQLQKRLYSINFQRLSTLYLSDLNITNIEFMNSMNLPSLQSIDLSKNKIISLKPLKKISRSTKIYSLFLALKSNPIKSYQFGRIGFQTNTFPLKIIKGDNVWQIKYENKKLQNTSKNQRKQIQNKKQEYQFGKVRSLNLKIQMDTIYTDNTKIRKVQLLQFIKKVCKNQVLFRQNEIKALLKHRYTPKLSPVMNENYKFKKLLDNMQKK